MSDKLQERQVHTVYRDADDALLRICYTAKDAVKYADEYTQEFGEETRLSVGYVFGTETVAQRNKNAEL